MEERRKKELKKEVYERISNSKRTPKKLKQSDISGGNPLGSNSSKKKKI